MLRYGGSRDRTKEQGTCAEQTLSHNLKKGRPSRGHDIKSPWQTAQHQLLEKKGPKTQRRRTVSLVGRAVTCPHSRTVVGCFYSFTLTLLARWGAHHPSPK